MQRPRPGEVELARKHCRLVSSGARWQALQLQAGPAALRLSAPFELLHPPLQRDVLLFQRLGSGGRWGLRKGGREVGTRTTTAPDLRTAGGAGPHR